MPWKRHNSGQQRHASRVASPILSCAAWRDDMKDLPRGAERCTLSHESISILVRLRMWRAEVFFLSHLVVDSPGVVGCAVAGGRWPPAPSTAKSLPAMVIEMVGGV